MLPLRKMTIIIMGQNKNFLLSAPGTGDFVVRPPTQNNCVTVCLIYFCISSSCHRSQFTTRWRSTTSVGLALRARSGAIRVLRILILINRGLHFIVFLLS